MKVYNEKTKRNTVVFNEYKLSGDICPECGRPLKEFDLKKLEENGKISCLKCGAKLSRWVTW